MRLPEINLQELEKIKRENFRERLEFQDRYVRWMKMTNNATWSSAQKAMINKKSSNSTRIYHNQSAAQARHTKRRSRNWYLGQPDLLNLQQCKVSPAWFHKLGIAGSNARRSRFWLFVIRICLGAIGLSNPSHAFSWLLVFPIAWRIRLFDMQVN